MKIEIVSSPVFYLPLTLDDVGLLGRMSDMHYDMKCRRISRVGGFLYGWSNIVNWHEEAGQKDYKVRAEWRELDILCKVMELLPSFKDLFTDEEYERIEVVRRHVHGAMKLAQDLHGSWQTIYKGE